MHSVSPSSYSLSSYSSNAELEIVQKKIAARTSWLSLMHTIYVGFVTQPGIEADGFISDAEKLLEEHPRYKLCRSTNDVISLGDIDVSLAGPVH